MSEIEHIEEYKKIADEHNVAFEFNDFFIPDVLLDKDGQDEIISKYLEVGIPKGSTMHGDFFDVLVFSIDSEMLKRHSDIDIYLENMFDSSPDILRRISSRLARFDNYGVCFDTK